MVVEICLLFLQTTLKEQLPKSLSRKISTVIQMRYLEWNSPFIHSFLGELCTEHLPCARGCLGAEGYFQHCT